MNKIQINIIDLKCNNIFSLSEACKRVGYKVNIIQDVDGFKKNNSSILMLPGVGSFNQAMKTLKKKHADSANHLSLSSLSMTLKIIQNLRKTFDNRLGSR